MLPKLDTYTPDQLKKFLTPKQIQREFGIDKDKLAYMRECSRDTGSLRGPMFLKDELIVLYQRNSIVKWIKQTMFQPAETDETDETLKSQKHQSN